MKESFMIAEPIDGGFTWTLASRLGDMLFYAEKLFGPRNKEFTVLGVEFSAEGPMIWYPKSSRNIIVQLSVSAQDDESLALYQLAHETVHLLNPSGTEAASVFEEGLAVFFSWWYLEQRLGMKEARKITRDFRYRVAGELVESFLAERDDLVTACLESGRNLLQIDLSSVGLQHEILTVPFTAFHPKLAEQKRTLTY